MENSYLLNHRLPSSFQKDFRKYYLTTLNISNEHIFVFKNKYLLLSDLLFAYSAMCIIYWYSPPSFKSKQLTPLQQGSTDM